MKASVSINVRTSALVDESDLKKISELLADRIGDVSFHLDCADEVERTATGLKELMKYENAYPSRIVRLRIRAIGEKPFEKSAVVDFAGKMFRDVWVTIEGRDDVVSRLRNDLSEVIHGMRPPYAILHSISFGRIAFGLCVGFLLMMGSWGTFFAIKTNDEKVLSVSEYVNGLCLMLICVGVFVGSGFGVDWLLRKVFPKMVFLIGQERRRYDSLEKFQWGVVISGVLGIITSALFVIF